MHRRRFACVKHFQPPRPYPTCCQQRMSQHWQPCPTCCQHLQQRMIQPWQPCLTCCQLQGHNHLFPQCPSSYQHLTWNQPKQHQEYSNLQRRIGCQHQHQRCQLNHQRWEQDLFLSSYQEHLHQLGSHLPDQREAKVLFSFLSCPSSLRFVIFAKGKNLNIPSIVWRSCEERNNLKDTTKMTKYSKLQLVSVVLFVILVDLLIPTFIKLSFCHFQSYLQSFSAPSSSILPKTSAPLHLYALVFSNVHNVVPQSLINKVDYEARFL